MHPRLAEIAAYLEARRAALLDAVRSAPPELLDVRPSPDAWSAGDVLEHLHRVEAGVAKLVSRRVAAARAAGLAEETETSSVLGSLDRARLTDRGRRITAPEIVRPSGIGAGPALRALEESRAALLAAIAAADGLAIGTISHPHQVLGELTLYQWLVFIGHHEARHTEQVRELLAAAGASLDAARDADARIAAG